MAKVRIPTLTCLRCGHQWIPRVADVRLCAVCKSPWWNDPRPKKKKLGRPKK